MTKQNLTNWKPKQIKYMHILADPTESRTDEQIASDLKVSRTTLYFWRQDDKFLKESYAILLKNVQGSLNKVFKGLAKKAGYGDVNAAKLILEVLNKLPQGDVNIDQSKNLTIQVVSKIPEEQS